MRIERVPLRYDDIDFDTVRCWRDDVREIRKILPPNPEAEAQLTKLIDSMQEALDTANGFNDPEPEPPIDEDKMKALQHRGR